MHYINYRIYYFVNDVFLASIVDIKNPCQRRTHVIKKFCQPEQLLFAQRDKILFSSLTSRSELLRKFQFSRKYNYQRSQEYFYSNSLFLSTDKELLQLRCTFTTQNNKKEQNIQFANVLLPGKFYRSNRI